MRAWASLLIALLAVTACSDDERANETTTTTAATSATAESTTTAPVERLTVLITNDDGVAAAGIDAVVEALADRPELELVVVAPAENQSGSGDTTTPGGAPASPATTASGHEATAVAGEPADAVVHVLDVAGIEPDLVISGINEGQNMGPIVDVSGTVGAARTAARRGIPAVAISAGLPPEGVAEPDYESAVEALLAWLDEHLTALEPGTVANLNVPTCDAGEIRGTVEVATAVDERNGPAIGFADCTSTLTNPVDDVGAFANGFIAVADPGLD